MAEQHPAFSYPHFPITGAGGYLHLDPTGTVVFCRGHVDDDTYVPCAHRGPAGDVARTPWVSV